MKTQEQTVIAWPRHENPQTEESNVVPFASREPEKTVQHWTITTDEGIPFVKGIGVSSGFGQIKMSAQCAA